MEATSALPSVIRHPRLLGPALAHPALVAQGWREAHSSSGVTFDDDPDSPRSVAYDVGRDLRLRGRA